jgi:hypothetical protein
MDTNVKISFNVPVILKTDILVVGGGPAGFCAAIAAARLGARTMLIEQGSCCGGMATQGLVGPFMTCYDKDGEIMIIRGLFEEVVNRLVERGGAIHPSKIPAPSAFTSYITHGHSHVTPFDPEILKKLMDDMLVEAGVNVRYHTSFVKPLMEGRRVNGVVVHSKSGLEAILADVIIDCTGDADVAYRAGVLCTVGDEKNGFTQPATMFFRIDNVDSRKVEEEINANLHNFYSKDGVSYRCFHWRVAEARAKGDWTLSRVSIGMYRGVKPDEWSINTSRIMNINGTDADDLTKAEVEGRKQVEEIFAFMKKYVPGCENAVLLSSASTIGIRETRHIRGEYTLTADDCLNGVVPDDSILLASNSVDVHGAYGPQSTKYQVIKNGKWYGVPYRCLLPVDVEQLIVAGRCVSATPEAAGAIRVMPPCMAMGHAAGVAAGIAIKNKCTVIEVDIKELRTLLKEQNAFLG